MELFLYEKRRFGVNARVVRAEARLDRAAVVRGLMCGGLRAVGIVWNIMCSTRGAPLGPRRRATVAGEI